MQWIPHRFPRNTFEKYAMSIITLDFETYYEKTNYTLKKLTYEQYIRHEKFKVHGVGIKIDQGPTTYYPEHEVRQILESIFTPNNKHTLIAHNVKFDGAILSWYYGLRAATYYCTQAMSRALWNQSSSGLGSLAERLWPDDKAMRKGTELENFAGIVTLTPEQQEIMGDYCTQDVDLTFAAFAEMYKFFPDEELDIINITERMFIHPVFVLDTPRVVNFRDKTEAERAEIFKNAEFSQTILKSPRKLAIYLRAKKGIRYFKQPAPTLKNPRNKKYPFGKSDLHFLELQDMYPELDHIWQGRITAASNIDITRAERMLCHADPKSGRIAMPLTYAAAHTMRWGGTNRLNPQNLRRGSELRKALKAPEGYRVVVRDLSNIEGRVLAWWAHEDWKCAAFAQGRDLYNELATKLFGRPVDRKRTEIVDGQEINPDFVEGFVGKTCELGLGYGMGPPKLRYTFLGGANGGPRMNFSEQQCREWVYTWRDTNANIVNAWKEADMMIRHMATPNAQPLKWRGLVVTHKRIQLPNNLFLNYPGLRATEDSDPSFLNFEYWNGKHYTNIYGGKLVENIIQALARIIIAHDMRIIDEHLVSTYNSDACIALTVHDELVAIAPTEHAEEVYEFMGQTMSVPPEWANDGRLALASEGGIDVCYSK